MNLEKMLEKYADLIVELGLNVQPGDKIRIRLTEEALPLARLVSKKAYEKGALNLHLDFSDDSINLNRYLFGSDEVFDYLPDYEISYRKAHFEDGYHLLALETPNPELLKSADPKRIARWQKLAGSKMKPLMHYTMQNEVKWCIAGVACTAWAKAAFPELPPKEGLEALWKNIFLAERIDQEDPVQAWQKHDAELKAHKAFLNKARFSKLHFVGPGTDLLVGLPEDHIWEGGSSVSKKGERFFPNIPTEEVFTMPHADQVEGHLAATMPLAVRGQIVDKFGFTFKEGKVMDYHAEMGKPILDDLLAMDEGAKRLGEVALVAAHSPIANTGILFKSTLFDENASCHFALGAAYSENLLGANERSEEENRKLGMNDSLIHVDFMVGSESVTVSGIQEDGSEIVLLKEGNWQI
ncbi:MAG: aminopeptidase [Anaerolineaceae bacterium]|nr:aminopeptidase [Anaerolineaceae bacterium]